jgi:hypothetical protein
MSSRSSTVLKGNVVNRHAMSFTSTAAHSLVESSGHSKPARVRHVRIFSTPG